VSQDAAVQRQFCVYTMNVLLAIVCWSPRARHRETFILTQTRSGFHPLIFVKGQRRKLIRPMKKYGRVPLFIELINLRVVALEQLESHPETRRVVGTIEATVSKVTSEEVRQIVFQFSFLSEQR